jgi:type I restriction enzyme S subunit
MNGAGATSGGGQDLPAGWGLRTLDELGTWTGGGTPKKSVADYWDGDVPWVSPKDMKAVRLVDTLDHITEAALQQSAAKPFPPNSIAFVVRSGILEHTLPVALIPFRAAANQDMKILTPSSEINPEWLLSALLGVAPDIRERCRKHGTTVASIEFAELLSYQLAVPPRAEQDRIHAAIAGWIEDVEAGLRAVGEARTRALQLRRAILQAASTPGAIRHQPATRPGDAP